MKKIIAYIIFFLITEITFSQSENLYELKDWQLKGYAESAERYNDDYSAVKYYSEYYKRNKNDSKTAYKLASLFFKVKNFQQAKPIFLDLYQHEKDKYPKAIFKYGQILKNEGKFDSAAMCFQIYRDELLYKDKKNERNLNILKVKQELKICENAVFRKNDNKETINVYKLNKTINKKYKESSPVIWNDTNLIYTSYMIDSVPVINIETPKNKPFEKYYSAKLINDNWQGGFLPPKPFINLENKSMSGGVLSDDGFRFYFAAGYKDMHGKIYSSIYVSKFLNGNWSEPEKLNNRINLKNYFSTQPAIGKCYDKNFDVIYFVSDRPGGLGGSDIWYTIYDKITGRYKEPVNAGSYVNTPENEITPRIDNTTKALYFSSDGHSGFGGYDIFKTFGELINWIPPKNIGKPLNSSFDDFWYTSFKNDSTGFIVSNRSENPEMQNPHCCFDVFEYGIINKKTIEITDTIFETDENFYDKLTQNKEANENIKQNSSRTVVKLHIKNNDNGQYICLAVDTTDYSGKFHFKIDKNQEYKLTVEKENYTPVSVTFNTKHLINNKLTVKAVTIIPTNKKPINLKNIYFEFNKWNLNDSSKQYLDTYLYKVLNKNKNIVIEISAYTDGIGDSDYNLVLSKNRAESVVNYLVNKGINKKRLIAKGYGEEKPIVSEFTKTGKDNPEGRAENRRIEFRVIGVMIDE